MAEPILMKFLCLFLWRIAQYEVFIIPNCTKFCSFTKFYFPSYGKFLQEMLDQFFNVKFATKKAFVQSLSISQILHYKVIKKKLLSGSFGLSSTQYLPCKGCLFDVIYVSDGFLPHDATEPLLGQLQQSITRCLDVRFTQTT